MDDTEHTPRELHDRMRAGESVRVLDIRDREAVEQWRIDGDSVNYTHLPRMKALQAKATGDVDSLVADVDGEGPITVVCAEGKASAEVAAFIREAGHDAHNLIDGMEGWAELYLSAVVDHEGAFEAVQYQRPATGCLSYLLVSGDQAAIVDPLEAFTERYVADAREHDARLSVAVDTHVHADHVSGVRALAADTDARAVVPRGAIERGADIDADAIRDGDELRLGDVTLRAVHAPGHTTDMTAILVGDVLLTGDSLFVESVARPDLEVHDDRVESLARELYRTLHDRFGRFDPDTLVCPGHHSDAAEPAADGTYTQTLGILRERLPALGLSEDEFVSHVLDDLPSRPANFERIVDLNLGRGTIEDAEARELELGPNNCAVSPAE